MQLPRLSKTYFIVIPIVLAVVSLLLTLLFPKNKTPNQTTRILPTPTMTENNNPDPVLPTTIPGQFSSQFSEIEEDFQTKEDFPPPQIDPNIGL